MVLLSLTTHARTRARTHYTDTLHMNIKKVGTASFKGPGKNKIYKGPYPPSCASCSIYCQEFRFLSRKEAASCFPGFFFAIRARVLALLLLPFHLHYPMYHRSPASNPLPGAGVYGTVPLLFLVIVYQKCGVQVAVFSPEHIGFFFLREGVARLPLHFYNYFFTFF